MEVKQSQYSQFLIKFAQIADRILIKYEIMTLAAQTLREKQ
jgi:hypothetical protein